MAPTLVIRADGGPGIGSGHLARCLALAQAWRDAHGEVTIVSRSLPEFWRARYEQEGAAVRPPPIDAVASDWVAVDGYRFGPEDHGEATRAGARLLVIDDHGAAGRYRCDVVLDQNLDANAGAYSDRSPSTELLLGTRFTLLRREFLRFSRGRQTSSPEAARRQAGVPILVALGSGATPQLRATVDRALSLPELANARVAFLEGTADVAAAMASTDLALAAAGSVCWELCFMGLPSVLFSAAANQVPLAKAMARMGAASDAGWHEQLEPQALAGRVAALVEDVDARAAMAAAGRELVDGRGAARVTTVLRGRLLHLRAVTVADCRLLWEWANDPAVREASLQPGVIGWEEHVGWLTTRLADPDTRMFLGFDASAAPLGQVRFQSIAAVPEISVSLSPSRRGEGLGPALVEAGVRALFAETTATEVLARVKPTNLPSVRAFESADFVLDEASRDGQWLEFRRRRR